MASSTNIPSFHFYICVLHGIFIFFIIYWKLNIQHIAMLLTSNLSSSCCVNSFYTRSDNRYTSQCKIACNEFVKMEIAWYFLIVLDTIKGPFGYNLFIGKVQILKPAAFKVTFPIVNSCTIVMQKLDWFQMFLILWLLCESSQRMACHFFSWVFILVELSSQRRGYIIGKGIWCAEGI